jgi:hypothetical protein
MVARIRNSKGMGDYCYRKLKECGDVGNTVEPVPGGDE